MSEQQPARDGNYALDQDGRRIEPEANWLCRYHETCGCTGYQGNPNAPGTCRDNSCTHPAYDHN